MLCLLVLLFAWSARPAVADSPGLVSFALHEGGDLSIESLGCAGTLVSSSDAAYEQRVVELLNAERMARGLPPLKLSGDLRDAARYHASDMAQDDYFEHDTYDRAGGRLAWVCGTWARIRSYYPLPRAENIAAGYTTPESVMAGWMGSAGHRDNLLNPGYREVGVGYVRGGSWRHYWVQDFGTRDDVYPLVIDGEAASTDSPHISLYLYGSWEQVRLRNDGEDWSSWRPFANALDWTLPARAGQHTVEVEMRAGTRVATSSDTISLDAAPALGGLPDEMRFLYSRSQGRLLPGAVSATPRNVGSDERFTWQATVAGSHFRGEGLSGLDGEAFRIVPLGYEGSTPGTYHGTVTVSVTDPQGVQGTPRQIPLTLEVVDDPFAVIHVPLIVRP
jgi:uncharacterized protein YkwD